MSSSNTTTVDNKNIYMIYYYGENQPHSLHPTLDAAEAVMHADKLNTEDYVIVECQFGRIINLDQHAVA